MNDAPRYTAKEDRDGTRRHDSWQAANAPTWARDLLAEEHAGPHADVAVWRAVHGVIDEHPRLIGTRQIGGPGQYQGRLERRLRAALQHDHYEERAWYVELPRLVQEDPWAPLLGKRLTDLERSGADIAVLTHRALDQDRPLPDSQPAAALWWRIAGQLAPAALDQARLGSPLRPDWIGCLEECLAAHETAATPTLTDAWLPAPAWPALVAAVDDTQRRHGWDPALTLASSLAHPPAGSTTAEHCESLLLVISRLADAPLGTDADSADEQGLADEPSESEPLLSVAAPQRVNSTRRSPGALQLDALRTPLSTVDRPVEPERIRALSELALALYREHYPRSWAPAYLQDRLPLVTLPSGHDWRSRGLPEPGYAPPGPQSLLRHLTADGITLTELAEAGLIRERERHGRREWVDQFRDRLVWPIRERDGHVVGFIGRRNPTKDDKAGPKYLNTPTTSVFTKGHHILGLAESRDLLGAGARPVLVEGPLDALAVTLCSDETAVGLAPLGTAVTRRQADLLAWASTLGRTSVVVATDADGAGHAAAERAYWELSLIDARAEHLRLPDGADPASLAAHDPAALRSALASTRALHEVLIERILADGSIRDETASRGFATDVAQVLAAQPAAMWRPEIDRLAVALGMVPSAMTHDVLRRSMRQDQVRADRILGR